MPRRGNQKSERTKRPKAKKRKIVDYDEDEVSSGQSEEFFCPYFDGSKLILPPGFEDYKKKLEHKDMSSLDSCEGILDNETTEVGKRHLRRSSRSTKRIKYTYSDEENSSEVDDSKAFPSAAAGAPIPTCMFVNTGVTGGSGIDANKDVFKSLPRSNVLPDSAVQIAEEERIEFTIEVNDTSDDDTNSLLSNPDQTNEVTVLPDDKNSQDTPATSRDLIAIRDSVNGLDGSECRQDEPDIKIKDDPIFLSDDEIISSDSFKTDVNEDESDKLKSNELNEGMDNKCVESENTDFPSQGKALETDACENSSNSNVERHVDLSSERDSSTLNKGDSNEDMDRTAILGKPVDSTSPVDEKNTILTNQREILNQFLPDSEKASNGTDSVKDQSEKPSSDTPTEKIDKHETNQGGSSIMGSSCATHSGETDSAVNSAKCKADEILHNQSASKLPEHYQGSTQKGNTEVARCDKKFQDSVEVSCSIGAIKSNFPNTENHTKTIASCNPSSKENISTEVDEVKSEEADSEKTEDFEPEVEDPFITELKTKMKEYCAKEVKFEECLELNGNLTITADNEKPIRGSVTQTINKEDCRTGDNPVPTVCVPQELSNLVQKLCKEKLQYTVELLIQGELYATVDGTLVSTIFNFSFEPPEDDF